MNDKELLEFAANAAGIDLVDISSKYKDDWIEIWNPLTNDGDALRLAVKLGMDVYIDNHPDGCACTEAYSVTLDTEMKYRQIINHGEDQDAATRRAIVQAAAAIGKGLK